MFRGRTGPVSAASSPPPKRMGDQRRSLGHFGTARKPIVPLITLPLSLSSPQQCSLRLREKRGLDAAKARPVM